MRNEYDLGCNAVSLTYDWEHRTGILLLNPSECCDMSGCIQMFQAIDTEVKLIRTKAGDHWDTIYKRASGEWIALYPPGDKRAA